jgi:hypothetical protein
MLPRASWSRSRTVSSTVQDGRIHIEKISALIAKGRRSFMTAEEEKLQFYAAIGEAITEWTHVEDYLCIILHDVFSPPTTI